jgi:hypothetical protein
LPKIPGVSSAALVNGMTMGGTFHNDVVFAEDRPSADNQIPPLRRYRFVSPGFFRLVGRRMVAGRDLTWTDIHQQRPLALVSENMARELWRDPAAALGKRIREGPKNDWSEIIGVVADERDDGLNKPAPTVVYWPYFIKQIYGETLFVRRFVVFGVHSPRTGTPGFLKEIQQAV